MVRIICADPILHFTILTNTGRGEVGEVTCFATTQLREKGVGGEELQRYLTDTRFAIQVFEK